MLGPPSVSGKLADRGGGKSFFRVAHLNMRSLNTGFAEMCSLVSDFDFDAFGVTETWLHPDTPSHYFNIPGYTMVRCDRHRGENESRQVGGGVALYIKQEIAYEQYMLPDILVPGIEQVCVTMSVKGQRLGVCVVYRPPHTRYTCLSPLFHSLFVDLAVKVDSVICLGDTNIDLLSKSCNKANYLRRLLKSNHAVQLIKEPTRVTRNSATLLDHIIVDKSAEIERNGVIDAASIRDHRFMNITDHRMVYCVLACGREKVKAKFITYRDFSKFDKQRAVSHIASIDWNHVEQFQNVNEVEKAISKNIKDVYDEQAPVVCKRVTRKKAPWLNDEIKKLTKIKKESHKKYWSSRKQDDWENYKIIRNRLNGLIWKAKREFFKDKLSSSRNPKEFWSVMKESNVVSNEDEQNNLAPNLKAEDINKFFAEMGSSREIDFDVMNMYKESRSNEIIDKFEFTAVDSDEVKSVMNEIKSKAVGSDNISIDMIKSVSFYAIEAITYLVNLSLKNGVFPENWKLSVVRPLPKVIKPVSVEQLRPISILPAMSKILEKIVIRQIMTHVNAMNILPKLQSGFRKNHSTCTALTNLISDLIDAKDKGKYSSLIMLDYSKAFDSIHHEMLLAKMSYFGFSKEVVTWIRSYLGGRLQITKLGGEFSTKLLKKRGVPQGSCLGPILYNLYTADFPNCLKNCTAHLYADDSQLHISYEPEHIESAIDGMNSDLEGVIRWSAVNGLELNVSKCTVLHTAPLELVQALNESGKAVVLLDIGLRVCDKAKTLGLVLDRNLTFSDHVTYTIQRALGRLRGLYRFRSLFPESAKIQLINSLILSSFYYCYPAYGNSISKEDKERIQRLQNSAVRFIFNLRRFDHVSSFREDINMLPMDTMCRMFSSCMVHKTLALNEPRYLSERLSFRAEVSQRDSRHGGALHFPRVSRECGRKSFSFFGPKLYNDLPDSLKQNLSVNSFKRKLRSLIIN